MAGDWIKLQHATPDKPEVAAIAERLGIDHDAALGKCLRLWIWADQQSIDGNALAVTSSFIDRITNCPGFADSLRDVGWLKPRNNGFMLPNFARHNGQTAKTRALTNDRVKRNRNAPKRTSSSLLCSHPPSEGEGTGKGSRFDDFWRAWPAGSRKVAKQQCREKWARDGLDAHADRIIAAVKRFRMTLDWEKGMVPMPMTWLNQSRWEAFEEPTTLPTSQPPAKVDLFFAGSPPFVEEELRNAMNTLTPDQQTQIRARFQNWRAISECDRRAIVRDRSQVSRLLPKGQKE